MDPNPIMFLIAFKGEYQWEKKKHSFTIKDGFGNICGLNWLTEGRKWVGTKTKEVKTTLIQYHRWEKQ